MVNSPDNDKRRPGKGRHQMHVDGNDTTGMKRRLADHATNRKQAEADREQAAENAVWRISDPWQSPVSSDRVGSARKHKFAEVQAAENARMAAEYLEVQS
jgi:hypothetical protein